MHENISKKRILLSSFLIALGVLLVFMFAREFMQYIPSTRGAETREVSTTTVPTANFTQPVRISIPSLEVDTTIEQVGVTESGYMGVPESYKTIGWYAPGFVPGHAGNAVMTGHLDNSLGLPGVFADLDEIEVGDEVRVVNEEGQTLVFIVEKKETYEYNDAPLSSIFGESNEVRLNLITCEGDWVEEIRSYDDRLIVFTVLDRIEE